MGFPAVSDIASGGEYTLTDGRLRGRSASEKHARRAKRNGSLCRDDTGDIMKKRGIQRPFSSAASGDTYLFCIQPAYK